MARTQNGDSVLSRVVRILDAFTLDDQGLRISDIADRTGLHVATTSRLVAELVTHDMLARDADGLVRTGVRLWELANRASPSLSLRETAMPYLEDLHAVVGHHVQLGVLDGTDVLFLERLSAPGAVVNVTRIAGRLPLHASAAGLALLAHSPQHLQETVLAGRLEKFTDNTIVDPATLRATLADVRRTGFSQCAGHIHLDASSLAAPIVDGRGNPVAAIGVIVPNRDGAGQTLAPALLATARGLSRAVSGRGAERPLG